jgi:hypothetical protein
MSRESYKAIERAKKIGAMSMADQRAYLESEKRREPESDSADCDPRTGSDAVIAEQFDFICKAAERLSHVELSLRLGQDELHRHHLAELVKMFNDRGHFGYRHPNPPQVKHQNV